MTSFVLFVDEMKRLHDYIYSQSLAKTMSASLLRQCLLDTSLALGEKGKNHYINLAVVISSLNIIATAGTSESDRVVKILTLPERLDVRKVVEEWWKIGPNDLMYNQFYLLAKLLSNVPRHCEVVYVYWTKGRVKDSVIDMKKLINDVKERIRQMYWLDPSDYPSAEILRSIVFQSSVEFTDKVSHAINKSIITNSLQNFLMDSNGKILQPIIPQASPLVLISLKSFDESDMKPVSDQFHLILKDIEELNFGDMTRVELEEHKQMKTKDEVKKDKIGDLLESLFFRWLIIRSHLCILTKSRITLKELLGKLYET